MTTFKMIPPPVPSSNIESVGHEGTELRVKFKSGSTYAYAGVGADLFAEMMDAKSIGSFVVSRIVKGPFTGHKL